MHEQPTYMTVCININIYGMFTSKSMFTYMSACTSDVHLYVHLHIHLYV